MSMCTCARACDYYTSVVVPMECVARCAVWRGVGRGQRLPNYAHATDRTSSAHRIASHPHNASTTSINDLYT